MNLLMKPALALMKILSTRQKIALQAISFGAGFIWTIYLLDQAGVELRDPVLAASALCVLAGNYFLWGRHVAIQTTFINLREEVDRFSAGDLRHRSSGSGRG